MGEANSEIDVLALVDPAAYAKDGPPHALWTRLRRESPLHRCETGVWGNFWAVTRHADICEISKRPDTYLSAPGIVLVRADQQALREGDGAFAQMRTIIEMDPPEHRTFRKVASPVAHAPRAAAHRRHHRRERA